MSPTVFVTMLRVFVLLLLAPASVMLAQEKPAPAVVAPAVNPLTGHGQMVYGVLKNILLRSAEIMPEEHYDFRPVDTVRTYGQIVGHIAETQYFFCASALGEKSPSLNIEKTKTGKAELIAALKESFVYCDKAYDGLSDANAADKTTFHGGMPRFGVLGVNNMHAMEHYGNLVTYLRMKGLIPPTSDKEFMAKQGR